MFEEPKKTISFYGTLRDPWIVSNWTGEIVRPWWFRKFISLLWDFRL